VTRRQLAAATAGILAMPAHAHGFAQRYDLPLPLTLYLSGAGLTVVLSCLLLFLFVRRAPEGAAYPSLDLLRFAPGRWLASPAAIGVLRAITVLGYALVLFAGFFGNQNPFRNFVPLGIWALWWVGMSYTSALAGDLWRVSNPLETLFAAAERAYARAFGKPLARGLALPPWVASWPAVGLYFVFQWMELVWDGTDSPRLVAAAIALYSAITWAGMWLYGREAWLAHGEAFTRVFGVLARFAPLHVELRERRVTRFELRPYAVGLLNREPVGLSDIVLVIAILAAVSLDGFLETPVWAAIAEAWAGDADPGEGLRTAALAAAPVLFLCVYLVFCELIARCGTAGNGPGRQRARGRIAGLFVLTLVPIAIAYQFAHYLSYLVTAWEYMISIGSDPFGWGWNLFGTVTHLVRPNIVDARLVWIISVVAIVAGHVAALYLGHRLSTQEFRDRRDALRSELPMLVLMVGYTMLSLWIIAQPIVNSR